MKCFNPWYIAVLLACVLGAWGCSQQRTGAISAKISDLEIRYAKLDEDYRTLQATNDLHRKKLNQAEAQRVALERNQAQLSKELTSVNTDRETLRKQIADRTLERDSAQSNLIQFSKELQTLAGRVEAAVNSNSPNNGTTAFPASRRNE